jgi:hypothetical protein
MTMPFGARSWIPPHLRAARDLVPWISPLQFGFPHGGSTGVKGPAGFQLHAPPTSALDTIRDGVATTRASLESLRA